MSKKQSNMLKEDILKILSKSVSGGSDLAPMYPNSKTPKTFFGGEKPSRAGDADQMKPYYPMAQEPNPAANPNAPLPTRKLAPGQKASKRPTYKSAKEPLTFFGGDKKCKKAKTAAKEICADEKKAKKKRAHSNPHHHQPPHHQKRKQGKPQPISGKFQPQNRLKNQRGRGCNTSNSSGQPTPT